MFTTPRSSPSVPCSPHKVSEPLVISCRGVTRHIDGRAVLESIDLEIAKGTCCALMGSNGAGKTTLLRLFAAALPPSGGTLTLFGASQFPAALRRRIGLIGHQSMLYRDLSCLENLVFFGRLFRVTDPVRRARDLLDQMEMSDRAQDAVASLSRGMVQRVAIARALMHDPDLLLADEPFMGLDPASITRLERCLLNLRAAGKTVVFSDHAVQHALGLSDRMIVLRSGRIALDAPSISLDAGDVLHAMEEVR